MTYPLFRNAYCILYSNSSSVKLVSVFGNVLAESIPLPTEEYYI